MSISLRVAGAWKAATMYVKIILTNYSIAFASKVNIGTYATVIPGNGCVRLDNGYLMGVLKNTSSNTYLMCSTDSGSTWAALNSISTSDYNISITTDGVYAYVAHASKSAININKYNSAGTQIGTTVKLTPNATYGLGDMDLCYGGNGYLYCFFSTKAGSTARYIPQWSYSTDGGVTWSAVISKGTAWGSSYDFTNFSLAKTPTGVCMAMRKSYPDYAIAFTKVVDTTWSTPVDVSGTSAYLQQRPHICTGLSSDYHIVWMGKDATDNLKYNIWYTESADGTSFSAPVKLTSGNTYDQYYPVVGVNEENKVHVSWLAANMDYTGWYTLYNIIRASGTWAAIKVIKGSCSARAEPVPYPKVIQGFKKFTTMLPIYIVPDSGVSSQYLWFGGTLYTGGWYETNPKAKAKVAGVWKES